MGSYIELTPCDRAIFASYKIMVQGLATFLGSACEIVLHSLEDLNTSAIKVINGHYSGRAEGAPITDLALEMLQKIKHNKNHDEGYVYLNHTKSGSPIRAATIPVIGEKKRIIGLLCINFYMDIPLSSFMSDMLQITETLQSEHQPLQTETFSNNSEELISVQIDRIRHDVYLDASVSASNKNKAIIARMYQMNLFDFKDTVLLAAKSLGISRNTVYLHLRNLQCEK